MRRGPTGDIDGDMAPDRGDVGDGGEASKVGLELMGGGVPGQEAGPDVLEAEEEAPVAVVALLAGQVGLGDLVGATRRQKRGTTRL